MLPLEGVPLEGLFPVAVALRAFYLGVLPLAVVPLEVTLGGLPLAVLPLEVLPLALLWEGGLAGRMHGRWLWSCKRGRALWRLSALPTRRCRLALPHHTLSTLGMLYHSLSLLGLSHHSLFLFGHPHHSLPPGGLPHHNLPCLPAW